MSKVTRRMGIRHEARVALDITVDAVIALLDWIIAKLIDLPNPPKSSVDGAASAQTRGPAAEAAPRQEQAPSSPPGVGHPDPLTRTELQDLSFTAAHYSIGRPDAERWVGVAKRAALLSYDAPE